jgi:hypothetical protein
MNFGDARESRCPSQTLVDAVPAWARGPARWLARPAARWVRLPLALLLIAAGVLGFLPVVGFWMVPLGVLLLAIDLPLLRKPAQRFLTWGQPKATHPMTDRDNASPREMGHALYLAWVVWSGLLFLTLAALAITVFVVDRTPATRAAPAAANRWLWVIVAYYVVVVTAALFRTGWLFRGYYRNHPVAPRTYLAGMTIVWTALAVGAWASLAVCLVTRTLLPNILLAGVGNVALLAMWPKGNAMAPPPGNPADPGR